MIIQYMSDLHLEYNKFQQRIPVAGDMLVLAGDICHAYNKDHADILANACVSHGRVVYIPGNHEYYHPERLDKNTIDEMARENFKGTNIEYSPQQVIDIDDVRVIMATLWADMAKASPLDEWQVKRVLNDFRQTFLKNDGINTLKVLAQNDIAFIKNNIDSSKTNVVVTHHAPLSMLAGGSDSISHGFFSSMDDVFSDGLVNTWIYGHTHQQMDRILADTRVLSNPLTAGFSADRVATIETK